MKTIIFQVENSQFATIKNVLKALGIKKIKIQEESPKLSEKTKFTLEEFDEMLDESKKSGHNSSLKTQEEVKLLFDSL